VSHAAHRAQAPQAVACFVLTVSDTRTETTDTSGRAIRDLLEGAGHTVSGHAIVRDEPAEVARMVREAVADPATAVVLTTGGTGITARDGTYEAIDGLLEKRLPGFGELFRMLSYEQIGAAAMLSRACAGTIGKTIVFSLPGSPDAVHLALGKLIVPELPHIVRELKR
jgi:molybdenum cofactor biosynthesis protein B